VSLSLDFYIEGWEVAGKCMAWASIPKKISAGVSKIDVFCHLWVLRGDLE
jgi:hypothetical protein